MAVHSRAGLSTSHDQVLDRFQRRKEHGGHPSAVLVTANWRAIWSPLGRTVSQWPNHMSRCAAAGDEAERSARTGRATLLSCSYQHE